MPVPQCKLDRFKLYGGRRYALANTARDSTLKFVRWHEDGDRITEPEALAMFLVTFGDKSIHVIAESEIGAKQQATCNREFGWENEPKFEAVRVPFMLRGMGGDVY
jgi:hypothetical protein